MNGVHVFDQFGVAAAAHIRNTDGEFVAVIEKVIAIGIGFDDVEDPELDDRRGLLRVVGVVDLLRKPGSLEDDRIVRRQEAMIFFRLDVEENIVVGAVGGVT